MARYYDNPANGGQGGFVYPASASLDTTDGQDTCNYHTYQVLKPFTVDAGAAAPWFAQPVGVSSTNWKRAAARQVHSA